MRSSCIRRVTPGCDRVPMSAFGGKADILPADLDGRSGFRPDEDAHMGGLIPLRPTVMFDATIVPSGSLFAVAEKTFSPRLRSASVAGAKVTTVTFGDTSNVFSPSLYF